MTYDVAIIGGGIIGAACAASLSAAGLSVVIIESTGIASGSTSAGMGHIVVMDDSTAQLALTQYSQRLWNSLAPELPKLSEFDNCGTIWIAADDEEMREVHRKNILYSSHGVASEILDEQSLAQAEPNLRNGLTGGLLVRGDSVVYQLFATRYLIDKAKRRGAVLNIGTKAVEIREGGVTLADGSQTAAGRIVNAAGADAAELSPELKIAKRKGHLAITERYQAFARHQLIELGYLKSAHGNEADSVAFNVQPRSTGQVLLGSSRQNGAEDSEIDYAILRRMTSRAFEYMPKLRELSITRVWTGFRPATPDNLPFIGMLPGRENVYVAAGHEGLGITTSLGTAELIADAILGRPSAIPVEPYSPSRSFDEH
ncbi:MAG: FAD-binding oxidoreductase [Pyrinomonadaceae bacterium]|nr:FAD-binding oxidoreductase [Acidobacteriota bacterium]MBK7933692.1 FAD-binding oxidoreductase [Acidobacteriota bacterium]MBP7376433.1 FAD-binding oxidoreductase [Pyrinomonadaceae bacterium]